MRQAGLKIVTAMAAVLSAVSSGAAAPRSGEWPKADGGDVATQFAAVVKDGSPEEAARAAQFLRNCENAPKLRDGLERQKGQTSIPADRLAAVIAGVENELRRCQVVTPEMQAQRKGLLERAMLGHVPGMAEAYGLAVDFHPATPQLSEALVAGLKAETLAGSSGAPFYLALRGESLGLSKREAYAYYLVSLSVDPSLPRTELLKIAAGSPVAAGLSDADKAEAEKRARELLRAVKQAQPG